ncbi:MAG: hypothetical protein EHM23_00900 [Acidobacteria bacterium]|nr:MAG: hypothetical protein EHM23_00900 [Acidobacteriota bacterium]
MTVTPDDIRAASEDYKLRLEQHCTDIVQQLTLKDDDSPVHNVEKYRDGLRVPIAIADRIIYVYCLPWARGWSIFTSPAPQDIYSFSWRHVTAPWSSYQLPVYCPRDVIGPYHCPPIQIAAAFDWVVRRVASREKRRRTALKKEKS